MISIIVPVYNAEKYLDDCFCSLENQTQRNFEVILVDDGSTDSSGGKCDLFVERNNNATVIHTENQGLLLARREGVKIAKGDYYAFLDSDDCLSLDFISIIEDTIRNQNFPDIITFDFSRSIEISFSGMIARPGLPHSGLYVAELYACVKRAVCDGNFNNLANKVIRRDVFDIDEDYSCFAGLMHGEDWLQAISIVDRGFSVYYLDVPLYYYRISGESSTHSFKRSQLDDLSKVFERLLTTASKWGSDYFQHARMGACRHLFMLISALAVSDNYSLKDKALIISDVSDVINSVCGEDLKKVINELRIDHGFTIWCAAHKCARLSMLIAKVSVGLYNMLNHLR